MKSYGAGHSESESALPEPLTGQGVWSLTTFALPSSQLSFASAAIYFVALAFLETGGMERSLFVLPFPGTACLAAVAAALAWTIAVRCRRRPGRIWPRIWALCLACLNSVAVIAGLIFWDRPWPLTLAVAGLAAVATLTPRLMTLRPDSPLVQRVAPISMIAVAVAILPTTCAVRRAITNQTAQRVGQQIEQIRLWTTAVREVTNYDWRRLEESPDAAAQVVARLKDLSFRKSVNDIEVWRSAAILGKDAELSSAVQQLSDEVTAGFAPERVPRVSTLKEPAVRWDGTNRRWERYSRFAGLSGVTGTYHQELGRLFFELESQNTSGEHVKLVEYQQHYASNRQTLKRHLDEISSSWTDNWAVFQIREQARVTGRNNVPLHDLLQSPLLYDDQESLAPGDLQRLTTLRLAEVKQLARGSPGCDGGDASLPRHPTGCRCLNFEENQYEYYRLDCYSYTPAQKAAGAELRIEMRVVYQSAWLAPLDDWTLPAEIYFHFLVPSGEDRDKYRESVMAGLADAARAESPRIDLRATDRGGSVAGGFSVRTGAGTVRVLRPDIVTLNGLTPEPAALRVRVVRGPDSRPKRG